MLGLLVALLLGAAPPHATLSAPAAALVEGTAWTARLTVRPAPRTRPVVVARSASGASVRFATRRIAPTRFSVRLALASPGRWALSALVGRRRIPLRTVTVVPRPPLASPLPGADAFRVCGGAGVPYPQYAVAYGGGSVWVACPRLEAVQRIDPLSGRVVARIAFPGIRVHTVAASDDAVWAIALPDSTGQRIDPATSRVAARVPFGVEVPYLWTGARALWIADDGGRAIVRVDPATNRVVGRYPVGDGPAGFATDGRRVWILNHRENSLDRIDVVSGTVTRLANGLGPADTSAAERMALAGGALWVTGRGLDLLRLDPDTGALLGRTEIGAAGIDVAASAGSVWVASYEVAAAPRGDPVLGALHRVDPASGAVVATSTPTSQTFADGFAVGGGHLWMVDSVHGLLLRL